MSAGAERDEKGRRGVGMGNGSDGAGRREGKRQGTGKEGKDGEVSRNGTKRGEVRQEK